MTEYSVDGGEPVVSENDGGDDPFVTEFTVTDEGEHVVEYGSTDNAGNEEPTQSVEFEILEDGENAPPVIDSITADPNEGLAPLEVDFSAEVSDPDGDELTYSWDFDGDGTEDSTEESPTHIYALPGDYEAELTVSDGELEASDSVTVTVTGDGGGEAELSLDAMPKRASVKVGKSKTFRARVGNVGDAAATGVRVCAKTPTRKATVRGRNCVRYANLAEPYDGDGEVRGQGQAQGRRQEGHGALHRRGRERGHATRQGDIEDQEEEVARLDWPANRGVPLRGREGFSKP